MDVYDLSARHYGHKFGSGKTLKNPGLATEKRPVVGTRNWPAAGIGDPLVRSNSFPRKRGWWATPWA